MWEFLQWRSKDLRTILKPICIYEYCFPFSQKVCSYLSYTLFQAIKRIKVFNVCLSTIRLRNRYYNYENKFNIGEIFKSICSFNKNPPFSIFLITILSQRFNLWPLFSMCKISTLGSKLWLFNNRCSECLENDLLLTEQILCSVI